jgi:hypothetical protein
MQNTNLRNLVIQILNHQTIAVPDKEKNDFVWLLAGTVGQWEKNGCYRIKKEFTTSTSMSIRAPSRAFPLSEYSHVRTKKYAKALLKEVIDFERIELLERANLSANEVIQKKRVAL